MSAGNIPVRVAAKALILTVAIVSLAACGEQMAGSPSSPHAASGLASNLDVDIDRTTVESSRVVAAQFAQEAETVVDPILQKGGHLEIAVFAQAGVAPVYLINQDIPPVAELDGVRRDNYIILARKNVSALVNEALGLATLPAGSVLGQQLAALPGNGSDIAGMVRTSVADVQGNGGGTVVVLTDGLQRSGRIDFATQFNDDHVSAKTAAKEIAPVMPFNASDVAIVMRGIGDTGTRTTNTLRSIKASGAWWLACGASNAASCSISPSL